jgi:hypothetical protein
VEDWHAVQGDRDRASRFEAEPPAGFRCNRAGLRQGRVYDKDLVSDDFLGEATTDADGHFSVTFSSDDFQGQVTGFEARPDIFVKVTNAATGKTTKSKVFEELAGNLTKNDAEEIMNLGDIEVD